MLFWRLEQILLFYMHFKFNIKFDFWTGLCNLSIGIVKSVSGHTLVQGPILTINYDFCLNKLLITAH